MPWRLRGEEAGAGDGMERDGSPAPGCARSPAPRGRGGRGRRCGTRHAERGARPAASGLRCGPSALPSEHAPAGLRRLYNGAGGPAAAALLRQRGSFARHCAPFLTVLRLSAPLRSARYRSAPLGTALRSAQRSALRSAQRSVPRSAPLITPLAPRSLRTAAVRTAPHGTARPRGARPCPAARRSLGARHGRGSAPRSAGPGPRGGRSRGRQDGREAGRADGHLLQLPGGDAALRLRVRGVPAARPPRQDPQGQAAAAAAVALQDAAGDFRRDPGGGGGGGVPHGGREGQEVLPAVAGVPAAEHAEPLPAAGPPGQLPPPQQPRLQRLGLGPLSAARPGPAAAARTELGAAGSRAAARTGAPGRAAGSGCFLRKRLYLRFYLIV